MRGNPHVEGRYNTTTYTTVRPTILPLNSWANFLYNSPNFYSNPKTSGLPEEQAHHTHSDYARQADSIIKT